MKENWYVSGNFYPSPYTYYFCNPLIHINAYEKSFLSGLVYARLRSLPFFALRAACSLRSGQLFMAGCIRGGYKRRLLQTLNSPYINQTPTWTTAPRKWRGFIRCCCYASSSSSKKGILADSGSLPNRKCVCTQRSAMLT